MTFSLAAPARFSPRDQDVHYFDPSIQRHVTKVLPGYWHVAEADHTLVATTSSCALLIVWDKANQRAAMAHFMVHPDADKTWTGTDLPCPHTDDLLAEFALAIPAKPKEGAEADRVGFVIGGGNLLLKDRLLIGQANIMKAVDWLHREKISLAHYDVGQAIIRKTYFCPANGELTIRRIGVTRNETVRNREEAYYSRLLNLKLNPTL